MTYSRSNLRALNKDTVKFRERLMGTKRGGELCTETMFSPPRSQGVKGKVSNRVRGLRYMKEDEAFARHGMVGRGPREIVVP